MALLILPTAQLTIARILKSQPRLFAELLNKHTISAGEDLQAFAFTHGVNAGLACRFDAKLDVGRMDRHDHHTDVVHNKRLAGVAGEYQHRISLVVERLDPAALRE